MAAANAAIQSQHLRLTHKQTKNQRMNRTRQQMNILQSNFQKLAHTSKRSSASANHSPLTDGKLDRLTLSEAQWITEYMLYVQVFTKLQAFGETPAQPISRV
jgi:hypothetical protein